jgi:hypothetical protein
MNPIIGWIWLAGGMQLVLIAVSFLLPGKLDYKENLAKVSPVIRQIFFVQHSFIMFGLLGLSGLCFFFAPEIVGGGVLGTYLSAGMALFWFLRLGVQIFFLDADVKRQHRLGDLAYKSVFTILCGIFTFVALQGVLP